MAKLNSYHFDVGNSNTGSVGMCLEVTAESKDKAVEIANGLLDKYFNGFDVPEAHFEDDIVYARIYVGAHLTVEDIDDWWERDEEDA